MHDKVENVRDRITRASGNTLIVYVAEFKFILGIFETFSTMGFEAKI